MTKFKVDAKRFLQKLKLSSDNKGDFQEEIQSHITEHVKELISQGMTEEEALKIVFAEFEGIDFSILTQNESDEDAMKHQGTTQGLGDYNDNGKYEAVGVFYAGFLILGATIGFISASWLGILMGSIIGIGAGNLAHGIIVLKK